MRHFVFNECTDEELQRFAETIGANFDEDCKTIYKGVNKAMGFLADWGTNTLTLSLTGFTDDVGLTFTINGTRGLNYENSGSSIVFGGKSNSSDSSIVQCAIVPYNSPSGIGYAYILNCGDVMFAFSDGTTATNECDSDNTIVNRVPYNIIPTIEVVSMAPLAIDEKFFQHAYVAYAAPEGKLNSTPFMLNSTRFIPLGGNLCIAMD